MGKLIKSYDVKCDKCNSKMIMDSDTWGIAIGKSSSTINYICPNCKRMARQTNVTSLKTNVTRKGKVKYYDLKGK
jgi:DNA-directed RNA polymerase subunit RPC12/RpoP